MSDSAADNNSCETCWAEKSCMGHPGAENVTGLRGSCSSVVCPVCTRLAWRDTFKTEKPRTAGSAGMGRCIPKGGGSPPGLTEMVLVPGPSFLLTKQLGVPMAVLCMQMFGSECDFSAQKGQEALRAFPATGPLIHPGMGKWSRC